MQKDWVIGLGWETETGVALHGGAFTYPYVYLEWKGRPLLDWIKDAERLDGKRSGMPYRLSLSALVQASKFAEQDGKPFRTTIGWCTCGVPGCWDLEAEVRVSGGSLHLTTLENNHNDFAYPFLPITLPWPQFGRAVSRLVTRNGIAFWRFAKKAPRLYPSVTYDWLQARERIHSRPKWHKLEERFLSALKYQGKVIDVHRKEPKRKLTMAEIQERRKQRKEARRRFELLFTEE